MMQTNESEALKLLQKHKDIVTEISAKYGGKIITIETPGKNKIVISDDEKSILLSDQNNNTVELSPDGIILDSVKDISINTKAKLTIDATAGIEISSQADVKVSGLNINQTANVGFAAKGNATAEVSSSGQTTVKGTLVMIN